VHYFKGPTLTAPATELWAADAIFQAMVMAAWFGNTCVGVIVEIFHVVPVPTMMVPLATQGLVMTGTRPNSMRGYDSSDFDSKRGLYCLMLYSLGRTRLLLRSFVHSAHSRNSQGEPCRTLAVGLRWRGEARVVSPVTGKGSGTSAAR
jgi:hypothetical protein